MHRYMCRKSSCSVQCVNQTVHAFQTLTNAVKRPTGATKTVTMLLARMHAAATEVIDSVKTDSRALVYIETA